MSNDEQKPDAGNTGYEDHLQGECKRLHGTIATLRDELTEAEKRVAAIERVRDSLIDGVAKGKAELTEANGLMKLAERQKEVLHRQLTAARTQHAADEKERDRLYTQADEFREQLSDLRVELGNARYSARKQHAADVEKSEELKAEPRYSTADLDALIDELHPLACDALPSSNAKLRRTMRRFVADIMEREKRQAAEESEGE